MLRLYDCCQESDGGVALVVTRAERTDDVDQPVAIVAVADAHQRDASITSNYYHDDLATYPEAAACARLLFARAGLAPADVDVAEIYENFSPLVFLVLEAYGFCGPGEAPAFIADGNIDPGGALPQHPRRLVGRGVHPRDQQHPGRRPPGARRRRQPGTGGRTRVVSSLNSGLVLGRV